MSAFFVELLTTGIACDIIMLTKQITHIVSRVFATSIFGQDTKRYFPKEERPNDL